MSRGDVLNFLSSQGVEFKTHRFEYLPGGGTARSSALLGFPEHNVIKSLIFESDHRLPLMVLTHGDNSVDVHNLARQTGVTKIWSCSPERAELFSGWPVGATNPFILKSEMPIYLEESVLELSKILINGGGRGLLVELSPRDLIRVVSLSLVRCAKEKPVVVSKAP